MMLSYVTKFQADYGKPDLRGKDLMPRPKLVPDFAKLYGGDSKSLLDIGCGNLYKIFPISQYFSTIVGIDPSPELIQQAKNEIQKNQFSNIAIIEGIAQALPKFSIRFDVVTAILSFWETAQIHNVINSEGIFLIECLGPEDKTTFTKYFGKDNNGWRGANVEKTLGEIESNIMNKLHPHFEITFNHNQDWETSYTKKQLWSLLNNTHSTVRNFNPTDDKNVFEIAYSELEKDGEVILKQNRLVIGAVPRG